MQSGKRRSKQTNPEQNVWTVCRCLCTNGDKIYNNGHYSKYDIPDRTAEVHVTFPSDPHVNSQSRGLETSRDLVVRFIVDTEGLFFSIYYEILKISW